MDTRLRAWTLSTAATVLLGFAGWHLVQVGLRAARDSAWLMTAVAVAVFVLALMAWIMHGLNLEDRVAALERELADRPPLPSAHERTGTC